MRSIKQAAIVRVVLNAFRIPYIYLWSRGHVKRRRHFSVDRGGRPVPWITYPAIDFLNNLDFSDCHVFEYGTGSSSLWWTEKAASVTGVEMDQQWYDYVLTVAPTNLAVTHCPDGGVYPTAIQQYERKFDVIVVDGAERYRCAEQAVACLAEHGLVILDNSDWYTNTAQWLRSQGFTQIDFYGFSPNNSFPTRTSIFCQSLDRLSRRTNAEKPVIGGVTLPGGALDDG